MARIAIDEFRILASVIGTVVRRALFSVYYVAAATATKTFPSMKTKAASKKLNNSNISNISNIRNISNKQ